MGLFESKGRGYPLCLGALSFCSLALGVLLLLMGVWCTHLYQRFTPVYTDITCKIEPPKLGKVSAEDGLQIQLIITTTCENPNPYSVEVRSLKPGPVYMGHDMREVASVTEIPKTTLESMGKGSIDANILITPNFGALSILGDFIFDSQIPIYLENNVEVVIDVDFLLGRFSTTRLFAKKCGLNVKGLLRQHGGSTGPMVCADDFSQLGEIPLPNTAPVGELRLSAGDMAEEEVEMGTRAKNVGLGLAMGLGYGLGSLLICIASCCLFNQCARRKGTNVAEEGNSSRVVKARKVGFQSEMQEV